MSGARLARRKIHQPLISSHVSGAVRYWVGGDGDWSDDTNHWALTSGGAPGFGNAPDQTMTVIFDANSSAISYTVTNPSTNAICYNMYVGEPATGFVTFNFTPLSFIYGDDIVFASTTQAGLSISLQGTQVQRIRSNGASLLGSLDVGGGGTLLLLDNLVVQGGLSVFNSSTFDMNYFNMTADSLATVAGIALYLRSGTFTLTGVNTIWDTDHALTFSPGTSTIKITGSLGIDKTFNGGSFTFYNLWHAAGADTANLIIVGDNTFNDIKDTGTAAHSILFNQGTTNTFTTFTVSGNGAGNEISIDSYGGTGTHTLVKVGGGTIIRDYLNIQHSVATPGCTWFAGANSINNQSVASAGSGWLFNASGVCGQSLLLILGVG